MNMWKKILIWVPDLEQELNKMDKKELLKHRMLKFRKIGGFQEGLPVDPKKKVNMKKKEGPIVARNQHLDLEGEVEKVKQQILKAKESSSEPPLSRLSETIEKLKKEVDHGFSEAAKSLGFEDKFAALREEFLKVNSQEQLVDPAFKNKIDKLREEFNDNLPKAPNYESLKSKLDMLKELSKAKNLAEKNQKAAVMKQEINEKFKKILERQDVKEKFGALKTEIQSSGVSKFADLDANLKGKIVKLKKELEFEFTDVLQTLGLEVEVVKSKATYLEEVSPPSAVKSKIEELNEEIEEGIEDVVNSSDLKYKIELLKLEIAKAGKKPDLASKKKIAALEQQIKQSLAAALDSSNLKEKHEKLKAEISKSIESSGGLDGSLKKENAEEARVKINVSANRF